MQSIYVSQHFSSSLCLFSSKKSFIIFSEMFISTKFACQFCRRKLPLFSIAVNFIICSLPENFREKILFAAKTEKVFQNRPNSPNQLLLQDFFFYFCTISCIYTMPNSRFFYISCTLVNFFYLFLIIVKYSSINFRSKQHLNLIIKPRIYCMYIFIGNFLF